MAKHKRKKRKAKKKPAKPPVSFLGFGMARRAAEALRKKERERRKRLGLN